MRVVLLLLVVVTGGKQSQLLVLSLSLKFDNIKGTKVMFWYKAHRSLGRGGVGGKEYTNTYNFLRRGPISTISPVSVGNRVNLGRQASDYISL